MNFLLVARFAGGGGLEDSLLLDVVEIAHVT
jgi:hypothetical protein